MHLSGFSDGYLTVLFLSGMLMHVHARYSVLHVRYNSVETTTDESCHRQKQHVYRKHVVAPVLPDVSGEWASHRCEVRSGPEFLLRKYKFFNNSVFEIRQYYYSDPACSQPQYSIVARGRYDTLRQSWTVPGGTESTYRLTHVTLMPYQKTRARKLSQRLSRTCPDISKLHWDIYERYDIYRCADLGRGNDRLSARDRDCMAALGLSFHELQLMRLEVRHQHHAAHRRLLLGNVHTDPTQRQLYRSTGYQEPLHAVEELGCHACRVIANSNDYYPPRLDRGHTHSHSKLKSPRTPPDLSGEWFSDRCETRPNGMFLTRHLLFTNDNSSWAGYYHYFSDPLCQKPMFTIHADGYYKSGTESPLIAGSYHFDFKAVAVRITPHDKSVVNNLNHINDNTCGSPKSWRAHVQQDVTSTKGCRPLGIRIPHTEYELVKLEIIHFKPMLYLGERPTDGSFPSSPEKRPTSFQSPVVRCDSMKSPLTFSLYRVQHRATSGSASHIFSMFVLLISIIKIIINYV